MCGSAGVNQRERTEPQVLGPFRYSKGVKSRKYRANGETGKTEKEEC